MSTVYGGAGRGGLRVRTLCDALARALCWRAFAVCATLAEVRKRGDDFWAEFEFYLSDLVVGCVMDVVLVTLMAPAAVIGRQPKSAKATGAP